MKRLHILALSLLLSCFSSSTWADDIKSEKLNVSFEKSEENIQTVLRTVNSVTRSFDSLFNRPIKVVAVERPEATPIAAVVSKKGWCIVVVNTSSSGWKNWNLVFAPNGISKEEAIEFAAAHEVGHCLNKQAAEKSPEQWQMLRGSDSELYADLFALSYLKGTRSQDDFDRLFESIVSFRKQFNFVFHRSHAISSRLLKSREFFHQIESDPYSPDTALALSMFVMKSLENS